MNGNGTLLPECMRKIVITANIVDYGETVICTNKIVYFLFL